MFVARKRSSGVTASLTLNCLVFMFDCERLGEPRVRSEVQLFFAGEGPGEHAGGPVSLLCLAGGASLGLLCGDVCVFVLPAARANLLLDVFEVEEAFLLVVLQLSADVSELGLELFLRRVRARDLHAFDVLHHVLGELDVRAVAHDDPRLDAFLLGQRGLVVGLDHEPVVDLELLAELVAVGDL